MTPSHSESRREVPDERRSCYSIGMASRSRASLRSVALAAVLALGCSDTTTPGEDAGVAAGPRVELGGGTSAFEPLTDGDTIELVSGPQGGFHINLTARLYETDIEDLLIDYVAVPVGGTAPISMPTELRLNAMRVVPEGDHLLRAGDFLVMDVTAPAEVVGMELEVTVRITETDGGTASDTRRLLIVDEVMEELPG